MLPRTHSGIEIVCTIYVYHIHMSSRLKSTSIADSSHDTKDGLVEYTMVAAYSPPLAILILGPEQVVVTEAQCQSRLGYEAREGGCRVACVYRSNREKGRQMLALLSGRVSIRSHKNICLLTNEHIAHNSQRQISTDPRCILRHRSYQVT